VALKAKVINLGDWLRPEVYSSPADECRAVHERVGLIDVSTLGRLDVRGPDATKILERLYINGWANLKVGRTRYGVMCDDAGIIFDDGTCARLSENQYYMTATTGGADTVYHWLQFWLAESPWDVCVTNVTSAYGGVNLAGPKAREVLKKVTEINLDSAAFPYLGCAQGLVAGVPSILFRIGFVGELGYEIHFPSEYGEYIWDALMEAGKEFGIAPFGVEAQRVLRLEKQHIIVGQDTDALSNPIEANLAWAVKMDKPDFVGKRAIAAVKERGARNMLVGFVASGDKVPLEGTQVMEGGRSIGRVTSARLSSYTNQIIGLAWVPVAKATEGTAIKIRAGEGSIDARVVTKPFYDPDGTRMKA
jgi:sarcosine oxidase subunit alpha